VADVWKASTPAAVLDFSSHALTPEAGVVGTGARVVDMPAEQPTVPTQRSSSERIGRVQARQLSLVADVRGRGGVGRVGVCAFDDDIALALLPALDSEGLVVPDDVAVVGVGDVPAGRISVPVLTAVRVDHEALAARVAACVGAMIDGLDPAQLGHDLDLREPMLIERPSS
jgi:DNA-binding LacI/PurR family transcriptional regulator